MIHTLGKDLAHVTEQAALACRSMIGTGDKHEADRLATEAMRSSFNDVAVKGTVVIGEGERDDAPMLFIGEEVGAGGIAIDIAVDPLEGTNLCADNKPGAITVLAVGPSGTLLHAPDTYMDKFVVGSKVTEKISLDMTPAERVDLLAKAYGCEAADISIIIMDRSRNQNLIDGCRNAGADVQLIDDGDVCAGVNALMTEESGIHAMMGIGAAPEGTITAVAVKALGGQMAARLMPYDSAMENKNEEVIARMEKMGTSLDTVYTADDLAQGDDVVFVATGVTSGSMLQGMNDVEGGVQTDTLVLSTGPTPIQRYKTIH